MDNNSYFNIFNTDIQCLDRITAVALEHGGDWCDIFFEHTVIRAISLKDGIVGNGSINIDFGVGIRVLKGDKTGYAYSESTSLNDVLAAARAAGAIAYAKSKPFRYEVIPTDTGGCRYPQDTAWESQSFSDLTVILKKLELRIRAKDNRVSKVQASITGSDSSIMMYNSHGQLVCDSRPMGSISASVIYESGGKTIKKHSSRSFRLGPDMMNDRMVEELSDEVTRGVDRSFEAKRPKGGSMPVVMGRGASGILLHEAMGHAFEADFIRKGQSIFTGSLGKKICSETISIVDDGTLQGNRGACNWDDEGVPGQKTYMVKDGVLSSFLHDRISASYFGIRSTGNGRRESFRYEPLPRMRATYMESGSMCAEDIISSVKTGIYVDDFTNGQVKIGEGDFTFFVGSGCLIENGRLTMPVKDINIIGNGPRALADITMVGNDLEISDGTWTCGKGQSVPVSCGIPTVLVKKLTVGGE